MSGKPYTMKEMKMIVEYLTENKAFGEIKGRKMWMDFSNTNLVKRTWQSLKETFLKRILPDIHNPYYKLTMDEIRSFRQGTDVTQDKKYKPNRLSKKAAFDSQEPSTSKKFVEEKTTAGLDSQKPSTSKTFADDDFTGEDSTCKQISPQHRSSVETVILEHTYENAEDIVRVLESPVEDKIKESLNDKTQSSQKKSLRDCITYTEPLTPMLLEVLHDFATDDEDNGKMKMLQNTSEKNIKENNVLAVKNTVNIENVSDETSLIKEKIASNKYKNKDKSSLKLKSKALKDSSDDAEIHKDSNDVSDEISLKKEKISSNKSKNKDKSSFKLRRKALKDLSDNAETHKDSNDFFGDSQSVKSLVIDASDSSLPNNQEGLENIHNVPKSKQVQSSIDIPLIIASKNSTPKEKNKHLKTPNTNFKKKALRSNKNKPRMSSLSDFNNINENVVNNASAFNSSKSAGSLSAECNETKEQNLKDISISDQINDKLESYVAKFCTPTTRNKNLNHACDDNPDTEFEASSVKGKKENQGNKSDIEDDNSEILFKAPNGKDIKKNQVCQRDVENTNLDTPLEAQCIKNHKTPQNRLMNQHNSDITNSDLENIENNIDEATKDSTSASVANPCLKSVSLYAEQFSLKKYSDTEGSCHENPILIKEVQEITKSEVKKVPNNEVTVLNSDVASGSSHIAAPIINKNSLSKLNKVRALDNLFGFSSGGVVMNRKRSRGRTSNLHSQNSIVLGTSDETSTSNSDFVSPQSKNLKQHNIKSINISSESSDSTSEIDGEFVSPPRKSRKKCKEKIKVKTNYITEKNGVVFVANDKKLYPVMRHGRTGTKHLTCWSDRLHEEEESYWKSKYVQERKKTSELTNVLNQATEKRKSEENLKSPVVSAHTSQNVKIEDINHLSNSNVANSTEKSVGKNECNKIKLKLAKKDCAVELEGHWQDIQQVFNQVMKVMYNDKVGKEPNLDACIEISSGKTTPLFSPDLREAKEKVNQIENEIFKEILEKDKEDISKNVSYKDASRGVNDKEVISRDINDKEDTTKYINNKEGTSKDKIYKEDTSKDIINKEDTSEDKNCKDDTLKVNIYVGDASKDKIDKEETFKDKNETENNSKYVNKTSLDQDVDNQDIPENKTNMINKTINEREDENKDKENVTVRKKRGRPKKNALPVLPTPENLKMDDDAKTQNGDKTLLAVPSPKSVLTKRKKSPKTTESAKSDKDRKTSNAKTKKTEMESKIEDEESEIRYKFPSPELEEKLEDSPVHTNDKEKELSNRYNMFSPPDISSTTTMESTQGYQDSDISIIRLDLRKRKRQNSMTLFSREKNRIQRKKRICSYPILTSDESHINNSKHSTVLTNTAPSSSLNSEIYRSESYQLLMAHRQGLSKQLEKISETHFCQNVETITEENAGAQLLLPNIRIDSSKGSNKDAPNSSQGNSSIISLPLSPEISIVENISVNKSAISSAEDVPNNNEVRTDNTMDMTYNNKYLTSLVDVSMPLVIREIGVETRLRSKSATNISHSLTNMPSAQYIVLKGAKNTVSESFIDKINSVNIQESQNMSESLDSKLKQLMLESAKKTTKSDELSKEGKENSKTLKSKARKRCSTPYKKQTVRKSQCPKVDTVIEEHMVTCSLNGRKSCPPSTTFFNSDPNAKKKSPNAKAKCKNKKNIIKVKITRPQSKSPQKTIKGNKSIHNKASEIELSKTETDKNDTESGIFLQAFNDTVELTHNHSDTCVRASDYIEDSIEFIENSTQSIISLNSSPQSKSSEKPYSQSILPDLFCTNACDLTDLRNGKECNALGSEAGTSHDTPLPGFASLTSLLTEDLSNEAPIPTHIPSQPMASDWYLFSAGESSNTIDMKQPNDVPSYGAKLEHIFPEICTVPNLSTITEMSRETDQNSRKKYVTDSNTIFDLD